MVEVLIILTTLIVLTALVTKIISNKNPNDVRDKIDEFENPLEICLSDAYKKTALEFKYLIKIIQNKIQDLKK